MNQDGSLELDRADEIGNVGSPTTSISSMFSEQSEKDVTRNSPFLGSQSSPLSSSSVFQRPEFLNANVPDSETSSRSSWDGINLKESTSEKIEKFRMRNNKRSPSGSGSDEDTNDGDVIRKISTPKTEDKFIGRGIDAPRGRIANIRRESNCSVDTEAAHERLVKVSQQVSTGFDEFSIESQCDYRRRTPSFSTTLGEPISVVTNAFIPHSCSPSPTRLPEALKQCYSPSTQQIIRPNLSYSPSPKQSPSQSPTRYNKTKFARSVSPNLFNRQTLKRKLNTKDTELDPKRVFLQRNNTSPLVSEKIFPYPSTANPSNESFCEFASPSVPHSPSVNTESSSRNNTPLSNTAGDPEDNSFEKETSTKMDCNSVEIKNDSAMCVGNKLENLSTDEKFLSDAVEASIPIDVDDL